MASPANSWLETAGLGTRGSEKEGARKRQAPLWEPRLWEPTPLVVERELTLLI
jgi:hypothetical protein